MSPNRLPRRLLYSELQEGRRSRGGQMKRFSDNVKLLLKKCQIPPGQLEALAADRLVWRDVCKDGLVTFSINYDQEAEARRLRRHTISSPPTAGPRCHICGRICASDFGLRSHLRIHNRPSSTSYHSVIVNLDGLLQASKQAIYTALKSAFNGLQFRR